MWNAVSPWILSVIAAFTINNIVTQQIIQKTSQRIEEQRNEDLERQKQELDNTFERQQQELRRELTGIFVEAVRPIRDLIDREKRTKQLKDQLETFERKIEDLKKNVYAFIDDTIKTAKELEGLADNLDEHFKRNNSANIRGASIVDGVVSVVGLALLVPSFGASLLVTAVGGGSSAEDASLMLKQWKAAEERLHEYKKRKDAVLLSCCAVYAILEWNEDIDIQYPELVSFWERLENGELSKTRNTPWDLLIKNIFAAVKLHRKKQHEVSLTIRDIARQLINDCPTIMKVDEMIQTVIDKYSNHIDEEYRKTDFLMLM